MMEYALVTSVWSLEGVSLDESLRRAGELGIPRVEVFGRGHGDPRFLSQENLHACVQSIAAAGVEVVAYTALLPGNPGAHDDHIAEANWAYFLRALDAAQTLGTHKVLHMTGEKEPGSSLHDAWERSVAFAQRCCEEARARVMVLLVELEPTVASLVRDLDSLRAYREAVAAPELLLNLDTGHLNVIRVAASELDPILQHVAHVHLSDNRGTHDAHEDLGAGSADLAAYVARVIDSGVEERCRALGVGPAVASIELHYGLVPPFARRPADESARRAWAYARDVLHPRVQELLGSTSAQRAATPVASHHRHEETP
jgi:sugar phosphate isomerase/epimerase